MNLAETYRPVKFSTLVLRFSNVVGKCLRVQQKVNTVLRLWKTRISARKFSGHGDELEP